MTYFGQNNNNSAASVKGLVYSFLVIGLATMIYGLLAQNWLFFGAAVLFPTGAIIIYFALQKPIWSYTLYAIITCYFQQYTDMPV